MRSLTYDVDAYFDLRRGAIGAYPATTFAEGSKKKEGKSAGTGPVFPEPSTTEDAVDESDVIEEPKPEDEDE